MSNVANPMQAKNQDHSMPGKEKESSGMGAAVAEQAEKASSFLADKASEVGSYVSEQTSKLASTARHSAENAGSYVSHRADDARHSMGTGIKSMGESLKSAIPEGAMHDAACSVAESLESTGKYLEEHGFSAMTEDLTNVIKRNPLPSVFIAAGIGFLMAKACTPSRSNY
jgi:hypothetical protein